MGFRDKFCIIGAPVLLFAAVAQGMSNDDPAPVAKQNVPSFANKHTDPFVITEIRDNGVVVTNRTDKDIFFGDLRFKYYAEDADYSRKTDWFRIWDLRAGESAFAEVEVDPEFTEARYFYLNDKPLLTAYEDNENGDWLKDVVDRRESGELTKDECYALKGYMPTQCEEFTEPVEVPKNASDELKEMLGYIEDGTFEYAQEFSGR